jgi:NitT/TauT family transport system permease protein
MRADAPPLGQRAIGDGIVVIALVAWWHLSRGLPSFILPGPLPVARRLVDLFIDPAFLLDTFASTWRLFVAVAVAVLLGSALALLADADPRMQAIIMRRINPVLNSFPSIGWAILAAIWFPVGDFAVIFVEVLILTPFCLINMSEGLHAIDHDMLEMAQSFSRSSARVLWRVTLPLLAPFLLSAVRIAYGVGWKIAIVAELLGAPTGLGSLMLRAQTNADATTFLAACFAVIIIFIAGERLVIAPLERRFAQ